MDERNLDLIKQSFPLVFQHKAEIASRFYEGVFRADPKMRAMFGPDLSRQKEMLAALLATMAKVSLDEESVHAIINRLARQHKGLGIKKSQFRIGEVALIDALEATLSSSLSPETMTAWRAAVQRVIEAMIHPPEA